MTLTGKSNEFISSRCVPNDPNTWWQPYTASILSFSGSPPQTPLARWVHVTHGVRASDGLTGPGGSASAEAPSSGARPRLIPHPGPPARVASHGSWLPQGQPGKGPFYDSAWGVTPHRFWHRNVEQWAAGPWCPGGAEGACAAVPGPAPPHPKGPGLQGSPRGGTAMSHASSELARV